MKKVFIAAVFMVTLASCEFNYIEPRFDNRDRIVGTYDIEEYSKTNNSYHYYSVRVSKADRYSNQIYIDNFYDANMSAYATFDGSKITIPFQTINGYEIEGTGNIYSSDLSITFRVRDTYSNYGSDFGDMYATRNYHY